MKDILFKKIKTVKNLAQAGDAVLAFYYDSVGVKNIEIERGKRAPLDNKFRNTETAATLWGPSMEFYKVPSRGDDTGSYSDSLQRLKFKEDEIKNYTHFIVTSTDDHVTIYRLDHLDYSEIVTGYF